MWKKLFGGGDKKEEDNDQKENLDLEKRIADAIRKTDDDKRKAEAEIRQIQGWAAEAIIDTYAHLFPNGNLSFYRDKYKTDALQKYETIKTQNADKVSAELAQQCEQLVQGYMNQIALRQSKMELYAKLADEYRQTQQKFKASLQQNNRTVSLDKHQERLRELDENTTDLANAIHSTSQINDLKSEVEFREEYLKQLELLSNRYDDNEGKKFDNALAYKEEVDNIIKSLGEGKK